MFDNRLQAKIKTIVEISNSLETGFNEAIGLAADCLANVRFFQEKTLISHYFDYISENSEYYCFGVDKTLFA